MGVVKFANGKRNQGIAKRIYTKGKGTGERKKKKHRDKNMTSVVSFLFRSLLQVKIATAPL